MRPIDFSRLTNHRNVALMSSGGKDSLALIHLFRDHLDSLTVYHGDTGDLLPETRDLVAEVAKTLPRFVRIESDVRAWITSTAIPSDLVPARCTPMGLMHHREGRLRICTMYECWSANRWKPWNDRLKADGITMMISGQRKADMRTLFNADGTAAQDIEMWLPIQDWSDEDVFAYLRSVRAPLGRFYEHQAQGPECATCPASWTEGRGAYLRKHHSDLAAIYARHMRALQTELVPVAATFMAELRDLGVEPGR